MLISVVSVSIQSKKTYLSDAYTYFFSLNIQVLMKNKEHLQPKQIKAFSAVAENLSWNALWIKTYFIMAKNCPFTW